VYSEKACEDKRSRHLWAKKHMHRKLMWVNSLYSYPYLN
jgi:hypothetical protein